MTFKQKVMKTVEHIIADLSKNTMFLMVKPIVNLAKPQLEDMLDEKPDEVYKWLVAAQTHIKEAIDIYENENNKVQVRQSDSSP